MAGVSSRAYPTRSPAPVTTHWWWSATVSATTWAEDGTIMGIRGPRLGIDGVQFHPEAVLTAAGHRLLANWLVTCGLEGALSAVPGTGAPLAVSAPHGGAHP